MQLVQFLWIFFLILVFKRVFECNIFDIAFVKKNDFPNFMTFLSLIHALFHVAFYFEISLFQINGRKISYEVKMIINVNYAHLNVATLPSFVL